MGRRPSRFWRQITGNVFYSSPQARAARRVYTNKWLGRFGRFGAGVGALAATAAANYFAKVPKLDTRPDMPRMIGFKRDRDGRTKVDRAPGDAMQKVTYRYSAGGKKVGKTKRLLKHLQAHVAPLVERWSLCNSTPACANIADALATMKGAMFLNSGLIDAATTIGYPVYLWDLTGVYNAAGNLGGAVRYPTVGFRLTQTAVAGNMGYTVMAGANAADSAVDQYSWNTEALTRGGAGLIRTGQTGMIDGFKIDLTSFGAAKLPSEVYVEMWRFADDKLCPQDPTGTSPGGGPGSPYHNPDQLRMDEFWRCKLGKMVGKMDHKGVANSESHKGVEIRRLAHFVFNPQNSTEALSGAGHQRNFHYFHRWNKAFKYDWYNSESTGVIPGDIDNPDVYVDEGMGDSVMCTPKPSSRWFLVVRGDVQVQNSTSTAATDRDLFPSFDLVLRRYRRLIKD